MSSARVAALSIRLLQVTLVTGLLALRSNFVSPSERAHLQLAALAAQIGARTVSGRPGHDFPHVPRSIQMMGPEAGRARTVLAHIAVNVDNRTPKDTAGVAYLLLRDPDAALVQLTAATTESADAETWNDLAVAYLELCEKHQNLQRCVDAVAASDAALARGGSRAVARFNRAAAMERLGLLREARREWLDSAEHSDGGWADEARANANRLPHARANSADNDALERALTIHDQEALTELLRNDARFVRAYGESIYPAAWADAWLTHKTDVASEQLARARIIGEKLSTSYGERLLADSVAAIDEALRADDEQRLASLARAYVVYREGRRAHSRTEATVAADRFHEAESLFARARSPMELVARYYEGSALFVQQKNAGAYTILTSLNEQELEKRSYLALDAQIGWELGLCLLLRGDHSAAIVRFEHSSTLLTKLNDRETRAAFEEFRADALEFIGDPEEAWNVRRAALESFSRYSNSERQITSLAGAASACLRRKEWRRAEALLGIAIGIAEETKNPIHAATCLIRRAEARVESGEVEGAKRDLADADRWRRAIRDAGPSGRIEADQQLVLARAMSMADPARARTLLNRAVDYYREHQLAVFAAGALLARARTLRRLGDADSAHRDLLDAIALIERQRRTLNDLQQRSSMLAASEEIFSEAVDLTLASGRTVEAFELTERSRGRALLDFLERVELRSERFGSQPRSLEQLKAAIASDAAIVEMIALPARLATFVVRDDGLQVVTTPTTPAALSRVAESCSRATASGDRAATLTDCTAAASIFIKTIEHALDGMKTIAVVPDRRIAGVPFAELPFRHGTLGTEVALIESPSATLAIECSERARRTTHGETLIISATEFDHRRFPGAPALPSLQRETEGVAAVYRNVHAVRSHDVTRDRLLNDLPRFGCIHWAGHVIADPLHPAKTRPLISSTDDASDLTALDIAGLKLALAPTVYISACSSGVAGRRGDGIESMALAFLVAGAPTVVASRWDIRDDEASSIAIAFHRKFSRGGLPAAALREILQERQSREHSTADGYAVMGGSPELVK